MVATKVSLVGSTAVGMTFLLSPVSGILADKYGIRRVAFFGSVLAFIGVTLSSFFYHKVSGLMTFSYKVKLDESELYINGDCRYKLHAKTRQMGAGIMSERLTCMRKLQIICNNRI